MRVLAIDLGSKRIGLALSDPEGRIPSPEGTLERQGLQRDLEALKGLVKEREVGEIVVGLPIHMDGRVGPEAEAAQKFASQLGEACGVPVATFDERWTTREAERVLQDSGKRGAKQRQHIDSVAASILLGAYLESRRTGGSA